MPTRDGTWIAAGHTFYESLSVWSSVAYCVLSVVLLCYPTPPDLKKYRAHLFILLQNVFWCSIWYHALDRPHSWWYADTAAQCLLLLQIHMWSWCSFSTHPACYLIPLIVAYAYPLWQFEKGGAMAFFITNIVFVFFALTYQEYWRPGCMRQRLGGVLILACLSSWLGMVYSVDGDLDQPLGQYGHLWIHFTQATLAVLWFTFWSQQREEFFIGLPFRCADCVDCDSDDDNESEPEPVVITPTRAMPQENQPVG